MVVKLGNLVKVIVLRETRDCGKLIVFKALHSAKNVPISATPSLMVSSSKYLLKENAEE